MADSSFQQEFLSAHNAYRNKHRAPALSLSGELNASAQAWANHLLSNKTLMHSKGNYGENLYYASSSVGITLTGKEAVDSWYNEVQKYEWNDPGFKSGTGHFTQVVWKDSTEVGVGVATDGNTVFVVGQYRPAGNMMGRFEENVLPEAGRESGGGEKSPEKTCTLL